MCDSCRAGFYLAIPLYPTNDKVTLGKVCGVLPCYSIVSHKWQSYIGKGFHKTKYFEQNVVLPLFLLTLNGDSYLNYPTDFIPCCKEVSIPIPPILARVTLSVQYRTLTCSASLRSTSVEADPSLRKRPRVSFSRHMSRMARAVLPVSFREWTNTNTLWEERKHHKVQSLLWCPFQHRLQMSKPSFPVCFFVRMRMPWRRGSTRK